MTLGTPLRRLRGWSAPPRNPRERRLLREGGKEPARRVGERPPCRVCGATTKRMKKDHRVKGGLRRACTVCEAKHATQYRARHRAAVNAYQRQWMREKRRRLREAAAAGSAA